MIRPFKYHLAHQRKKLFTWDQIVANFFSIVATHLFNDQLAHITVIATVFYRSKQTPANSPFADVYRYTAVI